MSAKTSAARREAFFRALAQTGNQTLAAERAKVSRSWVSLHRAEEPGFREAMEAAVAAARERLRERLDRAPDQAPADRGSCRPPVGWGSLDGEELVVRGTNGRRVQIARARVKQWTARSEARFLRVLAATCNVKAACAEVGLTAASAYARRQMWVRFAQLWDAAVEEGYMRIEAALVENAWALFEPTDLPPEAPLGPMRVDQAIHLLHMHQHRVWGRGRRPGRWRRPRSLEELSEGILRKLEPLVAAREASEEDRAAAEQLARDCARRGERSVADGVRDGEASR